MDGLLSMLVDLLRTFLQDVSDIQELSHINARLGDALDAVLADPAQSAMLAAILQQYYSETMTLYAKNPHNLFLDTLIHRIESMIQITRTIDDKHYTA